MQQRDNLAQFLLPIIVLLGLTLLIVAVDAQAQIAFMSKRDGNPEIYVMDIDGKNQRRLTNHPKSDWSPSWSPDGKRIVFMSERDGHVHVHGWPVCEIYVMDADGGNQQNLTNDPNDDRQPSWSPDGKRIVFTSWRDGLAIDRVPTSEIYVMDADGGNPQNLTNHRHHDRDPSWSPDGKQIAFSATRDGHFENDFGITEEIYVMDADGKNQQRLTENREYDWSPSWSPDGQRITFMSERDGNSEIYVIDADGGNPQNLTNNPHSDASPSWLNSPFSVSPVGKKFAMWGRLKQID